MDIAKELKLLGLKSNEIAVYQTLLRMGESSVGTIQSITGLHRQLIYIAAAELQRKGLVTIFSTGRERRFRASDPIAIEQDAVERVGRATRAVRWLRSIKEGNSDLPTPRVFTGGAAIGRYYMDSLVAQSKRSTVYIIAVNSGRFFSLFSEKTQFERIEEVRVRRSIRWRVLVADDSPREKQLNMARPRLDLAVIHSKVAAPIDIITWSDHVGILIYGKDSTIVDLPGRASARSFRVYFEAIWKLGTML